MYYGIPNTYMLFISIHYVYQYYISITLVDYKISSKTVYKISFCKDVKMGSVLCD